MSAYDSLASFTTIDPAQLDLRLVVCDMDGTLLDGDGAIPDGLWPILDQLRERDIDFVPASGRQRATLVDMFGGDDSGLSVIAENGTYVSHHGETVSVSPLDEEAAHHVVDVVREADPQLGLGAVLTTPEMAFVERDDEEFIAEAEQYFRRFERVDDLHQVKLEVLKASVFAHERSEVVANELFGDLRESRQVVVGSPHWIDIMAAGVDKGTALASLQDTLGISPAQTAVFGDYLNDLQMMARADCSFAMANAHEDLARAARFAAPGHTEEGVLQVLRHLFGR